MKIAIPSPDYQSVSGHAGRAKHWLVFAVAEDGAVTGVERIALPGHMVFHHVEHDDAPHPLDGADVVITLSAGDGFIKHMGKRGAQVALTAETDARRAVEEYLANTLPAPRPRPIGALICKTLDLFSKHK